MTVTPVVTNAAKGIYGTRGMIARQGTEQDIAQIVNGGPNTAYLQKLSCECLMNYWAIRRVIAFRKFYILSV